MQVLHKLKREYDELVQQWTKDYIWQKEPFELKLYQPGVDLAMQKKGGTAFSFPLPCAPLQCMSSSALCPLFLLFAAQELPHLWGRTRFGDSVDDEWFIVWLLFQLSRHDSDLAARYGALPLRSQSAYNQLHAHLQL